MIRLASLQIDPQQIGFGGRQPYRTVPYLARKQRQQPQQQEPQNQQQQPQKQQKQPQQQKQQRQQDGSNPSNPPTIMMENSKSSDSEGPAVSADSTDPAVLSESSSGIHLRETSARTLPASQRKPPLIKMFSRNKSNNNAPVNPISQLGKSEAEQEGALYETQRASQ